MSRIILSSKGIVRELGDEVKTRILHGVELDVQEGEFVALTGSSGSGKSTFLYVLGALDRPSEGTLVIDGIDMSKATDDERARMRNEKLGFVFQFHFLLPEFSVVENVEIPMMRCGVYGPKERRERARAALANLGIDHLADRKPHMLSGGQQQRVSIARAIASEPKLLLADEPTGNLDSTSAEGVMRVFEELASASKMAIVMVTHEPSFAARAHREICMRDGRIIETRERRKVVVEGDRQAPSMAAPERPSSKPTRLPTVKPPQRVQTATTSSVAPSDLTTRATPEARPMAMEAHGAPEFAPHSEAAAPSTKPAVRLSVQVAPPPSSRPSLPKMAAPPSVPPSMPTAPSAALADSSEGSVEDMPTVSTGRHSALPPPIARPAVTPLPAPAQAARPAVTPLPSAAPPSRPSIAKPPVPPPSSRPAVTPMPSTATAVRPAVPPPPMRTVPPPTPPSMQTAKGAGPKPAMASARAVATVSTARLLPPSPSDGAPSGPPSLFAMLSELRRAASATS